MSRLKDLLADLQGYPQVAGYMHELGFAPEDDIAPMGANPTIGDLPHDGEVSFFVHSAGREGYVLITSNDKVVFFDSRPNTIEAPLQAEGISKWAAQIDPPSQFLKWPQHISEAEASQSSLASNEGISSSIGIAPNGDFKASFLDEYTNLPIGHPAKDFLEGTLLQFGMEIGNAAKIKDEAERKKAAGDIYNRYFYPVLRGMKSSKAYYEAGDTIWRQFPHLKQKDNVRILYPAAAVNVGVLCTAMALIDNGAGDVDLIFTEVNKDYPHAAKKVLEQWLGNVAESTEAGLNGGQRINFKVTYKGKTVKLTYAMSDSPKGLYFNPDDLASADIAIVHDVYDEVGYMEAYFLTQLLSYVPREGKAKAIVITNEMDRVPDGTHYDDNRFSMLPVRGWRTSGPFGHGGVYPIHNERVGLLNNWCMPELGIPANRSGLIFSTHNPLVKLLGKKEDVSNFVDFALLAGGRIAWYYQDRGGQISECGSFVERVGMGLDKELARRDSTPASALTWADSMLNSLPAAERNYLGLVALRLIVVELLNELKYKGERGGVKKKAMIDSIPKKLKAVLVDSLYLHGFVKKRVPKQIYRLGSFNYEDLKRLDSILMNAQQIE